MQQQTTLLRFFSLSTIPLDIVNELFAQSQNVSTTAKKDSSEKKQGHKANSSSDFSIISLERTQSIGKSNVWRSGAKDANMAFISVASLFKNYIRGSPPTICPHSFIFCAFLILFFLLPRSSTNENYAAVLTIVSKYTQLGFPSWVFYCLINSDAKGKLL